MQMSLILLFMVIIQKFFCESPKRPNIYRWLAQNSYICDPTLFDENSHRFLAPRESLSFKCSCGDPLVTKSACGRRSFKEKPKCFEIPDACLQEYTVIFENGGNRMTKSINPTNPRPGFVFRKKVTKKPEVKKKTTKIFSTQSIGTFLRVRKLKKLN